MSTNEEREGMSSTSAQRIDPGRDTPGVLVGLVGYALSASFSIALAQITLGIGFLGLVWGWWRGKIAPGRNRERAVDHRPGKAHLGGAVRPRASLAEDSSRQRWPAIPFLPAYACLTVAGVLSLPFAIDQGRAWGEMTKFLMILVFLVGYAARLAGSQRRLVLGTLVGSGAVAALMTVTDHFTRFETVRRAQGFFSLPLTFGESQMLVLLVAVAWWAFGGATPRVRRRLLAAIGCLALGVAASFTRGVFIGLGIGLMTMFRYRWRLAFAALAATVLLMGAGLVMTRNLESRAAVLSLAGDQPDGLRNIRLRIWSVGLDILAAAPVFGVGMNNVKPHYQMRATPVEHARSWVYGHLHNSFLQYLAMTGLCGFFVFVWFCLDVGRFARRLPWRFADPEAAGWARAALPVWVAFLGSGLTENAYGDEEVAMLAFFLLGFLAAPARQSGEMAP